jgi:hypothetical protein
MKYDAGISRLIACADRSMLAIGDIIPEKSIDGVISPMNVTSIAATCVVDSTEMSSPSPTQQAM